jgi:hypothetical protein
MRPLGEVKRHLVSRRGAQAGAIVRGCGIFNRGLRVQVLQEQPREHEGPLHGRFIILDVGENAHSDALIPLVNEETDAEQVLRVIREEHPACISVVNARSLYVESGVTSPAARKTTQAV